MADRFLVLSHCSQQVSRVRLVEDLVALQSSFGTATVLRASASGTCNYRVGDLVSIQDRDTLAVGDAPVGRSGDGNNGFIES